jgi:hypothetical protein
VGFYPFSGQMWIGLLPYVALYFISIIVESRFKMKLTSEMGSLSEKEEETIQNYTKNENKNQEKSSSDSDESSLDRSES